MNEKAESQPTPKDKCGVVMPISAIDDCPESHWVDVRAILYDAIEDAEFEPNLVSDADEIGIIQKRIIQNLYQNPIVVCDVSAKNPNVMFELGIRLAFDKPTIIVKDDQTSYSFDTSPIEHLTYPRDLRFTQIVEFKEHLTSRIQGTHKAASKDANYTTFLKHFGTFSVAKLDSKEVSADELILSELRDLRSSVLSRPRRRDIELSSHGHLDADDYEEAMELFRHEISKHAKEKGLTRKADIRNAREQICAGLEDSLGPKYFRGPTEYQQFFNGVFTLIYG